MGTKVDENLSRTYITQFTKDQNGEISQIVTKSISSIQNDYLNKIMPLEKPVLEPTKKSETSPEMPKLMPMDNLEKGLMLQTEMLIKGVKQERDEMPKLKPSSDKQESIFHSIGKSKF